MREVNWKEVFKPILECSTDDSVYKRLNQDERRKLRAIDAYFVYTLYDSVVRVYGLYSDGIYSAKDAARRRRSEESALRKLRDINLEREFSDPTSSFPISTDVELNFEFKVE